MFSFTEWLILAVLALVLIGPKELPEVARAIGRFINQMRDVTGGVFFDLRDTQVREMDRLKKINQVVDTVGSMGSQPMRQNTTVNTGETSSSASNASVNTNSQLSESRMPSAPTSGAPHSPSDHSS